MKLHILCEKFGALYLVKPDFILGWLGAYRIKISILLIPKEFEQYQDIVSIYHPSPHFSEEFERETANQLQVLLVYV